MTPASGVARNFLQAIDLPVDHPAFAGHFPGRPIVPGVVLLDLALLAIERELNISPGASEIVSAKFLSPLLPGEPLQLNATVAAASDPLVCNVRFDLLSGDRKIASGHFRFPRTA